MGGSSEPPLRQPLGIKLKMLLHKWIKNLVVLLSLYVLMDSYFWFDKINLGLYIPRGPRL